MMKEMNRRTFLKAVGVAGAVSAMTALVGCSGGVIVPDGSTSLANLKPLNGYYDWNNTLPGRPVWKHLYDRCKCNRARTVWRCMEQHNL